MGNCALAGDQVGERVSGVAAVVAQWREVGEQQRRMPDAVHMSLVDAGLFGLAVERAHGGNDLDDLDVVRIVEELAREDASVAWNVAIAATGARIAAHLPESTLDEIYAHGPSRLIAGSLLPRGVAQRVDDGFYLSGRWSMASGCDHANWMRAPALLDGSAEACIFHVPLSECEVLDTWHTAGMRATASHDFRINRVFVPDERSIPLLMTGSSRTGALALPDLSTRARPALAAVALGIAADAIDSVTRVGRGHSIQECVGRAEALVRGARAYLHAAVRGLLDLRNWSSGVEDSVHADVRLACAYATEHAMDAVDLLYTAAGSRSMYLGNRLERAFRDVHVASKHVGLATSNFDLVGRYLLGGTLLERFSTG